MKKQSSKKMKQNNKKTNHSNARLVIQTQWDTSKEDFVVEERGP